MTSESSDLSKHLKDEYALQAEENLHVVGETIMSETEMVRRIEQWYDNLSDRDKKKFTDRLWARIVEADEVGKQDTQPEPKPEPRRPAKDPDPTRPIDPNRIPPRPNR